MTHVKFPDEAHDCLTGICETVRDNWSKKYLKVTMLYESGVNFNLTSGESDEKIRIFVNEAE